MFVMLTCAHVRLFSWRIWPRFGSTRPNPRNGWFGPDGYLPLMSTSVYPSRSLRWVAATSRARRPGNCFENPTTNSLTNGLWRFLLNSMPDSSCVAAGVTMVMSYTPSPLVEYLSVSVDPRGRPTANVVM